MLMYKFNLTFVQDTDQCYEVTDKGSSEDTSTSVYFGCFTSKGELKLLFLFKHF